MTDTNLSAEVVEESPRNYDFSEGYLEGWDIGFARTQNELENGEYEPMMNTIWPLPDGFEVPEDVRDKLDNMTIVEINRDFHLALTGGGMDMSWPIARTYVNLGLLPPAYLGDLPGMAGMDYDAPENRQAIEAMIESHRVRKNWSESSISKLESLDD